MTWSASARSASASPRAAKNWKVPTRIWLAATRVSTAPGSASSRSTCSPVVTAASARVVGMPKAAIASADDVFAQHRPQRRAPVAAPRKRRGARALQLDVAPLPVAPDHLAQQDGAPVAQARREMAELVAGIGQGDRLGTLGHRIAGQHRHALGPGQPGGVEAQRLRQRGVQPHQARCRDRRGVEAREQPFGQPRVGIVEGGRRAGLAPGGGG